ncbi:proline-rich protein 36-like [Camelus ferus]|uniref:Proline-rich protein 36-like n=1 Tax=Camelus ferus TaxID=419612 RepID=A0A8B8SXY8_CAMFR|nr:proline-rich protein 36-like [Camelus ferus]XP_032334775.1 proline-rich protein 36-like [Camelus ferus]XP_032334776.1 proline-rich protein 36-like [Camelus ferus]XP_032334777.1 proline-rich protein 36-like [Camelus ferus]XP_032334778.1 proline-rich protein 36-like [Camelus ferus]
MPASMACRLSPARQGATPNTHCVPHSNSTTRKGDRDHQSNPTPKATAGVGQGQGEGRQRASWRRRSSPQALKDRHSWKSWWSGEQAPGGRRAARSAPPSPSSELPGPSPVALPGDPQLVPLAFGQSGSGLHSGPRHSRQASNPGQGLRPARPRPRPQPGPSEGCFSHPDTSPINKESPLWSLPKQTPQQSTVPRPRQDCLGGPNSKPGLQARPPESHVTLLFREAPECALFWVPRALMLPDADAPHQGSKLTQAPKSRPEDGRWASGSPTGPLMPPLANGPRAARGLRSETLGLSLQAPSALPPGPPASTDAHPQRAAVPSERQGQGAGAALGTFLLLQFCALGSSPPPPGG